MKKILFVCDGDNYSQGAFEFIKLIRQHEPVSVKGLFFDALVTEESTYANYAPSVYNELLESENGVRGAVVERFINQCKDNDIRYQNSYNSRLSWNKDFWEKETRYADLMIMSQELLGAGPEAQQPNTYMLELLRWADCPVVTVPERVLPPECIIGATDGSGESMHALTQFCKMFPQYTALPAKFVYIKEERNKKIPDQQLLKEYVTAHFQKAEILKLHWAPGKLFTTWLGCYKNALVITGAFGRSALSNLLQKSFATQVVREQAAPVFIAH